MESIKEFYHVNTNHQKLIIETCLKYISFDDFTKEERDQIIESENKLKEKIKEMEKTILEKEKLQQELQQQKLQKLQKIQELKELSEKQLAEHKKDTEKMMESLSTLKTTMKDILDREGEIEDKIEAWYSQHNKDPNLNVNIYCRNKLCDLLEMHGEAQYFDFLFDVVSAWWNRSKYSEDAEEYVKFMELFTDIHASHEEVKIRALNVLRKLDYEYLRRFVTLTVAEGMSRKVIEFDE